MKLLISEVIKKASNAKTKSEKIKILKENNSQALRSVLKWNYDPNINTDLPELSLIHISEPTRPY